MGYAVPPPPIVPPGASASTRAKVYADYRAHVLRAQRSQARLLRFGLALLAIIVGLAIVAVVAALVPSS